MNLVALLNNFFLGVGVGAIVGMIAGLFTGAGLVILMVALSNAMASR